MAAISADALLPSRYSGMPVAASGRGSAPRVKVGYFTLPETADATDTVTIDCFALFGITKVLAVEGFAHTTTDSVMVQENNTTTVDRESITITIAAGTDNDKRFLVVYGI